MKAKDLFPDESERKQVKSWVDLLDGTIVEVTDKDGKVLFKVDI